MTATKGAHNYLLFFYIGAIYEQTNMKFHITYVPSLLIFLAAWETIICTERKDPSNDFSLRLILSFSSFIVFLQGAILLTFSLPYFYAVGLLCFV